MKQVVELAGGHPPFNKNFLSEIVSLFDSGARGFHPFFRCMILTLEESYGVMEGTTSLSSKGILLMRIPPGNLTLNDRIGIQYEAFSSLHTFNEVGIFIWLNRSYLEKYPPPKDVEAMYLHWVSESCNYPLQVQLFKEAFLEAFPLQLRSDMCFLDFLSTS